MRRGLGGARRPSLITDGIAAGAHLLSLDAAERPTAVFCANALIAVGLVRVATDAGLRIPDDLAVVGFDDTDLASAASAVELTSVHQPATEIGRAAVHVLLEEMADRTREHRDLVFEPELVVRESSTVRQPRRRPSGRRSTSG